MSLSQRQQLYTSTNNQMTSQQQQDFETSSLQVNQSNVKVVCRIRPPKVYDGSGLSYSREGKLQGSASKTYTSVRQRACSRSCSKDIVPGSQSPYRHYASLRQTSKEKGQKSNSKDRSMRQSRNKSQLTSSGCKKSFSGSGLVQQDKKYCVFTTKERSNIVIASENPVPGKIINESLVDTQDLKYFNNSILGQNTTTFSFCFDQVVNESYKQEKFYASSIRPAIKSFVEGENACILLFGPTEGGKTYTLKGKTGIERGILPRAVEDIFNIVRNSEEREEDYEMLNQRLMTHDYLDDVEGDQDSLGGGDIGHSSRQDTYPDNYTFNQTYDCRARNFNQIDQQSLVPERMFLKVSLYQIFVDKVLDLLTPASCPKQRSVQVDHYIDRESEEVVSKLKNITEKVVFSLEDFYSVLQEAFKNRRIESVTLQEQDLRKKAHFVISLTLMKRTHNKKLQEVSCLNFVELSGSEQAVAEEKFYQDNSIKQFITRSFNGLSTQVVRAAAAAGSQKKQKMGASEDGDVKIVNCLRNTMTGASNIVIVCCVNPGPSCFEHALPAIKFCARIRDCILKKQRRRVGQGLGATLASGVQATEGVMNMDDLCRYDSQQMQQARTASGSRAGAQTSSYETLKEIVDHLKDDIVTKLLHAQQNQGGTFDKDFDNWVNDRLDTVDRLNQRILNSNYSDRQQLYLQTELSHLKDSIMKVKYQANSSSYGSGTIMTPKQAFGPSLADTYRSSTENQLLRSEMAQQQDNLYGHTYSSASRQPYQSQPNPYQQQPSSTYPMINIDDQGPHPRFSMQTQQPPNEMSLNEITGQSRFQQAQTPEFLDSQLHAQRQQQQMSARTKLTPVSLQSRQAQSQGGKYNTGGSSSEHQHFIQTFDEFGSQGRIVAPSPTAGVSTLSDPKQISKIQMANASHSLMTCPENDFLSRTHPLQEIPLKGKKNSISEHNSPEREPNPNQTQLTVGGGNFRPMPGYQAAFLKGYQGGTQVKDSQSMEAALTSQKKVQGNPLQLLQSKYAQSFQKQNQTQKSRFASEAQQELINRRLDKMKQESVYQSPAEAMNDINRLIKLNDFEGLKLRVMQIYKEKEEQEKLMQDQQEVVAQMTEELESKDNLLAEQDTLIQEAHNEYQVTIEDIQQQKFETEKCLGENAQTFTQKLGSYKQRLKELKEEKEKSVKAQEILELENRELMRLKDESDQKMQKVQEENDKLKAHYEILKEHELNIVKDYEGKKNREITFYEQKLTDMHAQLKDEVARSKEFEEQQFRLKEEFRRLELENQKAEEDKRNMMEQIGQLGQKLEVEEEAKCQLQRQVQDLDRECQKVEALREKGNQERDKAFQEIEKLHLLIEEMEKAIQAEQQKVATEVRARQEKELEVEQLKTEKKKLEEEVEQRQHDIEEAERREAELQRQVSQIAKMNEDIDKQLTLIKAKEYDKVDLMKRAAELEARLKYLQVDNENLVKERNNLDIANVNLSKERQTYEQQILALESELDFFRKSHEDHLDKFDEKFEAISVELSKLKNENIQLKQKEKTNKRQAKDLEEERDEMKARAKAAEAKCEDMAMRLHELETQIKYLYQDREKDVKDLAMRQTLEVKVKDESKGKMLGEIQNMIKQYKDDKKLTKSTGGGYYAGGNVSTGQQLLSNRDGGYSTHSSVYY